MNYKLLKQPHLTEKTMVQKEAENKVTFLVDLAANKTEVKKAVEKAFNVTVTAVHTIKTHGKKKRVGRYVGLRSDRKKAVVTLKDGDKIEYFEGA